MVSPSTTDDCGCDSVSPSSYLMSVPAAVALAVAQVAPIARVETVDLLDAPGRMAARTVTAPEAMPYFDNSAMDGFALRCADLVGHDGLPIAGTVSTGDAPRTLAAGTALRSRSASLPYSSVCSMQMVTGKSTS